jgi:hypothetical protein
VVDDEAYPMALGSGRLEDQRVCLVLAALVGFEVDPEDFVTHM